MSGNDMGALTGDEVADLVDEGIGSLQARLTDPSEIADREICELIGRAADAWDEFFRVFRGEVSL